MHSLADILAAEADAVSAFVFLLQQEQTALKSGDADALPAIVEKKAAAACQLAPISASRNEVLARSGLSGDRDGMAAWLEKHPQDAAARRHWEKLQALAAEARELNRVNGELIRLRMNHNAQMLEALLASNRQDLYGADGQTSASATRRIIDSA